MLSTKPGEELLGEAVDPVEVLDDQQQGPAAAAGEAHRQQGLEGALLDRLRTEVVGRPVVAEAQHLQQQGHAGAGVDPQLGQAERGLGLDLGGRVAVRDAAVGAHDVGQRDVGDGRAVGEAAPLQHGEALGGQRAAQLGDDARLAHAGLADDAHDLAAAGCGLGHQLLKGGELALAADEASSGRRAEALQGRAPRPESQHAVRDHGLGPAANRDGADPLAADVADHLPGGRVADEDGPGLRDRLQPGCDVDRVADRRVVAFGIVAEAADHDRAAVEPHPHLDRLEAGRREVAQQAALAGRAPRGPRAARGPRARSAPR